MKKILTIALLAFFCISFVAAEVGESIDYSQTSEERVAFREDAQARLKIKDIRQDPLVANPGEHIDVYLKLENIGGTISRPEFIIEAEYPFSVTNLEEYEDFPDVDAGEKVTLHYKLKTDENAVADSYELRFLVESSGAIYEAYYFDIKVDEVTTDFDVALQEVTKEGAALALANIGKNDASSITVRVEDQEHFKMLGPGSHIIGNLATGDYTILNLFLEPTNGEEVVPLHIRIDYTDELGNRRTLYKDAQVFMSHKVEEGFKDLAGYAKEGELYGKEKSNGTFFKVTTVLLLLALIAMYIRQRKKKKQEA